MVRLKRGDKGIRRYFAGSWRAEALPVNLFVIRHPAGICLFDTGQTAAAAEPGYFPAWYPFFKLARFELDPEEEAGPQLAAAGIASADVRWVVLSHLHTDHAGGVGAFRSGEVLVSREEWARAQGMMGRLRGYLPQHWPEGLLPTLIEFEGGPIGPFDSSYDVCGDGRVIAVPTGGHTPGHLALLVYSDDSNCFLGGDLAESYDQLVVAYPRIAEFCDRSAFRYLSAHTAAASER